MKKKYLITLIILACSIFISSVFADDFDSSDIKKLEGYTTTASKSYEPIQDVPVPIQIITTKDIMRSGALDVGEVLGKYMTGHLHKYSGMLTSAGIRGFKTDSHGDDIKGYVLVLVDGHRAGIGNVAKLSLDRVKKIEILKGPASALYGAAAMGGIINIITKKGQGPISVTPKAEFGSFDYQKLTLSSEKGDDSELTYHVYYSYEDMDNYKDPEFGEVYNTARTQKNFGGNLYLEMNENSNLRFGGNYADNTGGYSSWNAGAYSSYSQTKKSNYDKSCGYADLEYNLSVYDNKLDVKAVTYYLFDRNQWNYGSVDPNSDVAKYEDSTLGLDLRFVSSHIDGQKIVFGTTMENLEKESEGKSGGLPSLPYTPAMDYDSKAIYVQDSISLSDNKLNIVIGGRYDKFDLKTNLPNTGSYDNFVQKKESYDKFTAKIGSVYKVNEGLRFRLNIGEGFKSPSADQLSAQYEYTSWGSTKRILGNPNLEPETSLTIDAGFDFWNDFVQLGVTLFNTDYEDKIQKASQMVSLDGKDWQTLENSGDATLQGIDISFELLISELANFEPELSYYANITFNTKFEDKKNNTDLKYISDYEFKSGLKYTHKKLDASISYVLVGPQQIDDYSVYPYGLKEHDTFDFTDIYFAWNANENCKIEFNVYNLFDQRVEWVHGHVQPERSYKAGVSYKFA